MIIPDEFAHQKKIDRYVSGVATFQVQQPYVLLNDVLDIAYQNSTSEYLIFSNMDILIQPYFYKVVDELLEKGHDALLINRKRIPKKHLEGTLEEALATEGKPHPGFDCFVFKRSLIPQMHLEGVCVGVPFVGVTLAHNIFALAENYELITRKRLTTHIGMEVMPERLAEYHQHNKKAFLAIKEKLSPLLTADKLPYAKYPFWKRTLKRALNPSILSWWSMELEAKGKKNKLLRLWEEIRFSITRDKQ